MMDLLLDNRILSDDANVAKRAVEQFKLFLPSHPNAQLLLTQYSPKLTSILATLDLKPNRVLSVFDLLQQTVHLPPRQLTSAQLTRVPSTYAIIPDGTNKARVEDADATLAKIDYYPDSGEQVASIHHLDRVGNVTLLDTYDERGFLSRSQTFHRNHALATEQYFTAEGEEVCLNIFMNDKTGKLTNTICRVKNSRHEIYEYDNLDQLLALTLDQYADEQDNVRLFTNSAYVIPTKISIRPLG